MGKMKSTNRKCSQCSNLADDTYSLRLGYFKCKTKIFVFARFRWCNWPLPVVLLVASRGFVVLLDQ